MGATRFDITTTGDTAGSKLLPVNVADVPAGWFFSVNRQAGTSATIVNCVTQSMTA